jgi:hypothetical protein
MKHTETCRPVFKKKLNILTLASQYILSLMTLMINNLGHFTLTMPSIINQQAMEETYMFHSHI